MLHVISHINPVCHLPARQVIPLPSASPERRVGRRGNREGKRREEVCWTLTGFYVFLVLVELGDAPLVFFKVFLARCQVSLPLLDAPTHPLNLTCHLHQRRALEQREAGRATLRGRVAA